MTMAHLSEIPREERGICAIVAAISATVAAVVVTNFSPENPVPRALKIFDHLPKSRI